MADSRLPVRLDDGRSIVLRPVIPEDRARIEAGVRQMSDLTRYFRFFAQTPQLSEAQLRYFTEVDQVHHVAWAAVEDAPGQPGVGLGRFIRIDGDETAEFALAVVDPWQHHGVGRLLLAKLLLDARRLGVRTLRGYVLADNERMMRWMRQLGARCLVERNQWRCDLSVDEILSAQRQAASVERLHQTVMSLQR